MLQKERIIPKATLLIAIVTLFLIVLVPTIGAQQRPYSVRDSDSRGTNQDADTDALAQALLDQGISPDCILDVDTNGIPIICEPHLEAPEAPGAERVNSLYSGTRSHHVIPSVVKGDGSETFRVEVNTNGDVKSVNMDSLSVALIPTTSTASTFRDDGFGADLVADDNVYTAGPFRFNTAFEVTHYFLNSASVFGLDFFHISNLTVTELDNSESRILVSPVIGVLRPGMPSAPEPVEMAENIRVSPYIINVRSDTYNTQNNLRGLPNTLTSMTQSIYDAVPDRFDFLVFMSGDKVERQPFTSSRNFITGLHRTTKIDYTGTGRSPFNASSSYGSNGRLQGINFLDAGHRGIKSNTAVHELVHQWSAFTSTSLGLRNGSGGAHYLQESSAASLVGGFQWIDNGDGSFLIDCQIGRNGSYQASPIDKYMMGLIPGSEVPTIRVYDRGADNRKCVLENQMVMPEEILREVTIQDIQRVHGVRTPGPESSQRDFRIAFVVESHGRFLTPSEYTFYNILAEHFTSELAPGASDPYQGFNWVPITRFFGNGTTWTSHILSYQPKFAAATSEAFGAAGTTVLHTVELTNDGTFADSYDIEFENETWQTSGPVSVGPLNGGETTTIQLSVAIPDGASDGSQGTASIIARAQQDNTQFTKITLETLVAPFDNDPCTSEKGLLLEQWNNIPGNLIADLLANPAYPADPTARSIIETLDINIDSGDDYGVRIRGHLLVAETGEYRFRITGDDQSELWLSTDNSAENRHRIAFVNDWSMLDEWNKYLEQTSQAIMLEAGQTYFIESYMKEWWGGDHLRVHWQTPGEAFEPIPNQNLCALNLIGQPPEAVLTSNIATGTAPLTVMFNGSQSNDPDGTIVSYDWDFGNGVTASGSTTSYTYVNPGVFTAALTVTDNDGRIDVSRSEIVVESDGTACTETGLLHEWWTDIPGYQINDLTSSPRYPDSPSGSDIISDFETPTNRFDNYGTRVRGLLYPPVSGYYTFWLASDDNGALRLSSDETPQNAEQIAHLSGWVLPREWDWYAEQKSERIYLQANQGYYIEALMKEWHGFDSLAVAWEVPGGTRQLIPSQVLCPFDAGDPPVASIDATPTSGPAPLAVSFDASASYDPDGSIVAYDWTFGTGATASGAQATQQSVTYSTPGLFEATLTVTDDNGRESTTTQSILVTDGSEFSCSGQGVTHDFWDQQYSGTVAELRNDPRYPDQPLTSGTLPQFLVQSNYGDVYAQRMRAYLVAPESGIYRFYVASDNEGQLWLSEDENPGNVYRIAQTNWSAEQDWGGTSGFSTEIALTAGQAYYIEGLHTTSWGSDYYAVAWDTPSGGVELIPNDALCVYDSAENNRRAGASPLQPVSASRLAQSLSISHQAEIALILSANQPLRAQLLDTLVQFDTLRSSNGSLSAEFIQTLTTSYDGLFAQASPELQAWMGSSWEDANLGRYEDVSAKVAWETINETTVPTAVRMHFQLTSMEIQKVTLLSMLLLLTALTATGITRRK